MYGGFGRAMETEVGPFRSLGVTEGEGFFVGNLVGGSFRYIIVGNVVGLENGLIELASLFIGDGVGLVVGVSVWAGNVVFGDSVGRYVGRFRVIGDNVLIVIGSEVGSKDGMVDSNGVG